MTSCSRAIRASAIASSSRTPFTVRGLHSTRRLCQGEAPSQFSPLDRLWSSPNAFKRGGGEASPEDELNREWGSEEDDLEEFSSQRVRSSQERTRRGVSPALTQQEREMFSRIFARTVAGEARDAREDDQIRMPISRQLIGNALDGSPNAQLDDFFHRNIHIRRQARALLRRDEERKTNRSDVSTSFIPFFKEQPKAKPLIGFVRENLRDLDKDEIKRGIDQVQMQLYSCQTQSQVWQWAVDNVWGTSNAQFGIQTPYYAPALLDVLKDLRDRFRAPRMALGVLHIARNAGPQGLVLGCTPDLYAEAIRTLWFVLEDLDGAVTLLREAKDTGILTGTALPNETFRYARFRSTNSEDQPDAEYLKDEEYLTKVISDVQSDVRSRIWRAQQMLNRQKLQGRTTSTSSLLANRMRLVEEMSDIVNWRKLKDPSLGPTNHETIQKRIERRGRGLNTTYVKARSAGKPNFDRQSDAEKQSRRDDEEVMKLYRDAGLLG